MNYYRIIERAQHVTPGGGIDQGEGGATPSGFTHPHFFCNKPC